MGHLYRGDVSHNQRVKFTFQPSWCSNDEHLDIAIPSPNCSSTDSSWGQNHGFWGCLTGRDMRIIQHSAVTVLNKKRNSPVTPPFFFTKTTEFNSKNSPATLFFSQKKTGIFSPVKTVSATPVVRAGFACTLAKRKKLRCSQWIHMDSPGK